MQDIPGLPDTGAIKAFEDFSASFQLMKWIAGVVLVLLGAAGRIIYTMVTDKIKSITADRDYWRKYSEDCQEEKEELLKK